MMLTKKVSCVAAIGAMVALLAACGASTSEKSEPAPVGATPRMPDVPRVAVSGRYTPPKSGAARDLIDVQAHVAESGSSVNFEAGFGEFLPEQEFSINGSKPTPASGGILIGNIVAVDPGTGYAALNEDGKPDQDADRGTAVAFDDVRSMWRVVVVTIKVDRALTTNAIGNCTRNDSDGCTAKFGYSIYNVDPDKDMKGLLALDDVVVVLDPQASYDEVAEGLPAVARSGSLLGDIDQSGFIGFPALGEENKTFVGARDTVGSILKLAQTGPPPIIRVKVDLETGVVERTVQAVR